MSNARPPLMPVAEALERISWAMRPVAPEIVGIADALGRVLAEPVTSRRTHPPFAVSAMDGYAVRSSDVAQLPAQLTIIGQAPAGASFLRTLGPGQAVRIFTGGAVPQGADAIVIQEDTTATGDQVTVQQPITPGKHIRLEGLDFRTGDVLLAAGRRLGPRDVALAAAMNVPWLAVRRRPRVALLATGDELVRPGEPIGPDQIVSSNSLGLAAIIKAAGGEAIDLGIAADNRLSLRTMAAGARGADMLITLGGASVGDHDLVRSVLGEAGLKIDFWNIAMRPGKPLIFGHILETPLIGLPGNPVSALVCALLFVRPALSAMLGESNPKPYPSKAVLGADLRANDNRQDYLRASLSADGIATAFAVQDSAMLSSLARADCLIIRAPFAPQAKAGDMVQVLLLDTD